MTILFITLSVVFILWMIYSAWSAPLMRQNVDGSWTTIQQPKRLRDLFKNKKIENAQPSKIDLGFDKDALQKLAGITPHNKESAPFNLINNKLNENIVEQLKNDFENNKFPKSDESIPVRTDKVYTIQTKFNNELDPLATISMSRVSPEAKLRMAEIAKEDINKQLQTQTSNLHPAIKAEFDKELEEANKIMMTETKPKVKNLKRKKK